MGTTADDHIVTALQSINAELERMVAGEVEPYEAGLHIMSTAVRSIELTPVVVSLYLIWAALTDWPELRPEEKIEADAAMLRAAAQWLGLGDDGAARGGTSIDGCTANSDTRAPSNSREIFSSHSWAQGSEILLSVSAMPRGVCCSTARHRMRHLSASFRWWVSMAASRQTSGDWRSSARRPPCLAGISSRNLSGCRHGLDALVGRPPNKRINLTRPTQVVVSSGRSPRRLCATRWADGGRP